VHRRTSAPAARRAPATPLERRRQQRRAGSAAPGAASSDDCAWLGAGWPERRRSRSAGASASASGRAGASGAGSAGASSDSAGSCARARRAAPAAAAGPAPPPRGGAGARPGGAGTPRPAGRVTPATAFRAALLLGGGAAGSPGASGDGRAPGRAAAGAPASACVAALLAGLFAERRQLRAALADLDAFCRSETVGPARAAAPRGSRAAAAPACMGAALCESEDPTHQGARPTLQQGAMAQLPARQACAGTCPAGAPAPPAASPGAGPPAAPAAGGGGVHSHTCMRAKLDGAASQAQAGPEPGPAPWADALRWPLARLEAETASVTRCDARASLCDSACPFCLPQVPGRWHFIGLQLSYGLRAPQRLIHVCRWCGCMSQRHMTRPPAHVGRQCQGMGHVAPRLRAAVHA